MAIGLLLGALGLAWFTRIGVDTGYVADVLPAELIASFGLGLAFVPLSSTALIGVAPHDAGVASVVVNATQQIGGSLGTALLDTVAASATATYLVHRSHTAAVAATGLVHGYTSAFVWSATFLAIAVVSTTGLVRATRRDLPAGDVGGLAL